MSPEIQNRDVSSPTKRTDVLQICFLKKGSLLVLESKILGQQLAEVACSDDTRPVYITHQNTTLIETINYPLDHPAGTQCEWVITPDNAPEVHQSL